MSEPDPRANPLARGPLVTRADIQRAVRDLYEPLRAHTSPGGARVRLGSFGATFEQTVAELEGYARPLYGIVPLSVGGGEFEHWDTILAGLEAGTNPDSPEYWGPIAADGDQRMVEQAAIGLALAFCPEHAWEPLDPAARQRLVTWLQGVFEHEPAKSNWQFFRVLVALGLERVGAGFDRSALAASLRRLEQYRSGDYWYVDGKLGRVDYYVPCAFHTYGLYYAAANALGLGDDGRAADYRELAAGFAEDFQHWFAPDGAAIPMGRSLTYRFAMASFWGALAWANVDSGLSWGEVRGLSLRHLRWWADRPISDRDGVLSVGFAYDNRVLAESYSSAGSPYWCMKAFAPLAAAEDHPFWTSEEQPQPSLDGTVTLPDAGWVVARDYRQAIALVVTTARRLESPEQAAAKYGKFAYSSAFGLSGDIPDGAGVVYTDSMLALADGPDRRVRKHSERAGVEDGMAWSTWLPWPDVRIDTVCVAVDGGWHLRLHRIRMHRRLHAIESGFALGYTPAGRDLDPAAIETAADLAVFMTERGCSAIVGLGGGRDGTVQPLTVNANAMHSHTAVPALVRELTAGDHLLVCGVFASPVEDFPRDTPPLPPAAEALLERIGASELP